jgi:hypothetical protein
MPWVARLLVLAAIVLVIAWGFEASPQRLSLAELAAGGLGRYQTWVIVSGELTDEPDGTTGRQMYRLTDHAAPNANLIVRSSIERPLGWTTMSGHLEGGRDGVPVGYTWTARLDADPTLAAELPPPWTAILLTGGAILIWLARRTAYPVFAGRAPEAVGVARGRLPVRVRRETDSGSAAPPVAATLDLSSGRTGSAELHLPGAAPMPIRLYSSHTSVDVGELHGFGFSEPAIRVRASVEDLAITFASARDRDATFAALHEQAQARDRGHGAGRRATV